MSFLAVPQPLFPGRMLPKPDTVSVPEEVYIRQLEEIKKVAEGVRHDAGKNNWSLLPFDALDNIAERFTIGATKYPDRNWEKGMAHSRVFNSLMRHLVAYWNGEDRDAETGQLHLTAVAWNAIALLTYKLRGIGTDDRPNATSTQGKSDGL